MVPIKVNKRIKTYFFSQRERHGAKNQLNTQRNLQRIT